MRRAGLALLPLALLGAACDWDYERMIDQPSARAFEPSTFLPNGTTLQPAPPGTVSRDALVGPPGLLTGLGAEGYVESPPFEVDRALLARGRNRFELFCATCHGLLGDGQSEVAENMQRVPPPSLHLERLRSFPVGRLFAVASQGYGLMTGYSDRISLHDRWAVVAYVQALQLSQYARLDQLPPLITEEALTWLK